MPSEQHSIVDFVTIPLSTLQREVWLDQSLYPDVPIYNAAYRVRIAGPLDVGLFERALEHVIARHDALRVVLVLGDELPIQRILPCLPTHLSILDFSEDADAEGRARQWVRDAIATPFKFDGTSLFRFALLKVAPDCHDWLTQYHHVIVDGWSMALVVQEVANAYNALLRGDALPEQRAPSFTHFIADDLAYLDSEQFRRDEAYWKHVYRTVPEPLFQRRHDIAPADALRSHQSARLLGSALCSKLRAFAIEYQLTLSQIFLAALTGYFARTMQRDDITFGLFSHHRHTKAFEQTLGLIANAYSTRYRINPRSTFVELLQIVDDEARRGAAHQRFPMSHLMRTIGLLGTDRPRPFDIAVSFSTGQFAPRFGTATIEIHSQENGFQHQGLAIFVESMGESEQIRLLLDGNCTLFSPEELERVTMRIEWFVHDAISNPHRPLSQLSVMPEGEAERVMTASCGTRTGDSRVGRCIQDWIEARAAETPHAIAVEFEDEKLTYAELNARANQWAHHLRTLGVGPEVFVGSCVERSPAMIVTLLAIWKAGGAYVPLDPEYPQERLALVVSNARIQVILSQSHFREKLPHDNIVTISIDALGTQSYAWPDSKPEVHVHPDNAAYAIFTSGSSGIPKGVVVTHANLEHLAFRLIDLFAIQPRDRILQFTAPSWDTSFEEIVPCLLAGGQLVLRTSDMVDPVIFLRKCHAYGITIVDLPTAFFHELVSVLVTSSISFPESIHTVAIGGETARADKIAAFLEMVQHRTRVINTLGLTEATAVSTSFEVRVAPRHVPIGIPLPNVNMYLLDGHLEPVPLDVVGEMFIGGAGVAREYLGRPAFTAERFVPDPFSSKAGSRMIRTGDLAERRSDGVLLFHGRADQQIKIRGMRVEPGEVEAALGKHAGVREVLVELQRAINATDYLVAYVIPDAADSPSADELLHHARMQLPAYMVPTAVIFLNQWPRLPTGKINRHALPAPSARSGSASETPATPTEKIIVRAFAEVLNVAEVGRHDDFFQLGGHSLLAIRLMSTLQTRLGFAPPMATVFRHPTVHTLASFINDFDGQTESIRLLPRVRNEPAYDGLSSMERRLWFLERLHPEMRAYQAPHSFRVQGELDERALISSLHALAMRHEILRTTYSDRDGEPIRQIGDASTIPIRFVDISSLPETERSPALQKWIGDEVAAPFDLKNGPLTRLLVVRMGQDEHFLLLNQHHIITDEWSGGVLLREWSLLYEAAQSGQEVTLPPLSYQYAEFARAEAEANAGDGFSPSRSYWKEHLAHVPRLELPWLLPARNPGPEALLSVRIPTETSVSVSRFVRTHGCTEFMVWYAAILALLSRYSGQTDFGIGSVAANRDAEGTTDLLGFFTNRIVLRTDLAGNPTFLDLVRRARKTAVDAYRHQTAPFDRVVQDQGVARQWGELPFYDVSFFPITMPRESAVPNWSPVFDMLPDGVLTAKNALSIALLRWNDVDRIHVAYDVSRIDAPNIHRFLDHLQVLITDALKQPGKRLSQLQLLTANELAEIATRNQTREARDFVPCCIHEWFENQVIRQPAAIAVEYGDAHVSYAELNERSNGLAHHLRDCGVRPEVRVGLCTTQSIDMLVGMLAILKAGGAYVPLDATWPRNRIAQIIDDAAIPLVLAQSDWVDRLPKDCPKIAIDNFVAVGSTSNLPPYHTNGQHAAYVLFTSGSTGKPKGVIIEHRQLVKYVAGIASRLGFDSTMRYGFLSTFAADLGNTTLFASLALGGTLRVVAEDLATNPRKLAADFEQHPVDVLKIAPSHLSALLTAPQPARILPRKRLVLGGEPLRWNLIDTIKRLAPDCTVTNHYGPTETTIGVLTLDVSQEIRHEHVAGPSLGKPRSNVRVYVLDAQLSPLPVGLPGELYIGGLAVGRGYLERRGLTAEKFVPDPFAPDSGQRMYRTGDLARWNDAGHVEFMGRIDHQVKIRGFRIELGEIEAALMTHAAVRACVVTTRADVRGDKRLVAYVVPQNEESPREALRDHLGKLLPEFMIPATFVILSELPLMANGKVDRSALPQPEAPPQSERVHMPPRNALEESIVEAWQELLHVQPIGVTDDFFALGGHSLLAVRLISSLEKKWGIAISVAMLFQHPTVESLAKALALVPLSAPVFQRLQPIPRATTEAPFAGLSSNERRLWFLQRLHPNAPSYHVPLAFRVRGELDIAALQVSLSACIERHEILRTTYPEMDGVPQRAVSTSSTIPLRVDDASGVPEAERKTHIAKLLREEIETTFDLERGPLVRAICIRQTDNEHLVVLHLHHIITDEWANSVLLREWFTFYEQRRRNEPLHLPQLPFQYADVARAEHEALEHKHFAQSRAYWREKLAHLPRVSWPFIRATSSAEPGPEHRVVLRLPSNMSRAFKSFARQYACTPFMAWYALFTALLSRYAQETEFGIGTVVANRESPGTEGLPGFFTNTILLRADVSGDPTVQQWLARARATTIEAYEHQQMPFDIVVRDQGLTSNDGHLPIVDLNIVEVSSLRLPPSAVWQIEQETESDLFSDVVMSAKDALTIAFENLDEGIALTASFDSIRVNAGAAERLLEQLQTLAGDAMAHPDKRLSELDVLSAKEWGDISAWNDTAAPFPAGECIHTLIQKQVARTPDAIAVIHGDNKLTYRELDTRANDLARHLRLKGTGPDVLVGLCVHRSVDMVVAMLGILKAGGAYVPIDPELPEHRQQFLIADAKMGIVVTQTNYVEQLRSCGGDRLELVCVEQPFPVENATNDIPQDVHPQHLTYVVYTSGSTGEPKGVMIEHQMLVAHASAYVQFHHLTSNDRVLALTPPHFDASVEQIFPALSCGACVIVADWDFEPESFSDKLIEFGVTLLDTSGAHWRALVDAWLEHPERADLLRLRTMVVGGDVMPAEVLFRWHKTNLSARARLVNVYGPTETTVAATAYAVPHDFNVSQPRIPIGKPFAQRTVFVLDQRMRPVPFGVPGELYIGGIGPARGYLNQPDLTKERFLDAASLPFVDRLPPAARQGRIYRTGDLCCWLPDGSLDFLGRADNQVKIRGYRVELGEIEAHLRRVAGVIDAVVVVHEQGLQKSLVAYVMTNPPDDGKLGQRLASSLRQTLPEYMVPSYFVQLLEIPRSTTTGKVIHAKLPPPEFRASQERMQPRTSTERRITEIFQALLKCSDIAVGDDFFELGGHSLLATQLVSHMRRAFDLQLPLQTVFEHRSVEKLATLVEQRALLDSSKKPGLAPPRKVNRDNPLPLSFGQERLWFLDRMGKGAAFHVSLSFRIEGPLDIKALEWSLSEIVRRHESLRATFVVYHDEPRQVVQSHSKFALPIVDMRMLPENEREAEVARRMHEETCRPFDLSTDLLLRGVLLWIANQPVPTYILLATVHHIASDGWSLDLLAYELTTLYEAHLNNRPSPLPDLALQIGDVAVWQRETLTQQALAPHIAYWQQQLLHAPPVLQLPLQGLRREAGGRQGICRFALEEPLTGALRGLAHRAGATMFMTLLAAFQVLLGRCANQNDVIVGTPVSSRNHENLEKLIGFFVNNLPIRTNLSGTPSFRDVLVQVRQTVQAALEHQDLPFEKLVEQVSPARSVHCHPIFQAALVFHETPGAPMSLPGLIVTPLDTGSERARLDLEMHLDRHESGLQGVLYYDSALFDAAAMETLCARFLLLLQGIVDHPEMCVHALPLLSDDERQRILIEWNDTTAFCPNDLCAHDLIAAQAIRTPNAIAVLFDEPGGQRTVTYRALISAANQLAHHLCSLGIGPEKPVGLCLEPSIERIVALIGILVAGGAYLPLDPTYPRRRLDTMVQDTQPPVIVTHSKFVNLLPSNGATVVCLDHEAARLAEMPTNEPPRIVRPDNLAYVIYTSGSTGKPKGVLVPHRGLVNVAQSQRAMFQLGPEDRVLQWAALNFDSAVAEIWMTLSSGATLCLGTREQVLPGVPLVAFLERNRISMITLTPSALASLPSAELPALHTLAVAGEACTPALVATWARGRRFLNLYGPTEATIWSTASSISEPTQSCVIGCPIQNTQVYVLNGHGQPAPPGTPGELYVGGMGIARGYLNQPALTATRFLPNPFGAGRLYRTGDLVRLHADGNIEFLGRTDQQIKLRGFRIELGEIEAVLAQHPDVREAVVIVREDQPGEKQLAAYVVPTGKHGDLWRTLRAHLRSMLPEFMIPAQWILLEELPRSANGKADRHALPQATDTQTAQREVRPPRTHVEEALAEIWCEVLGLASVGINERFFDLGGHSLLVTRVAARIHRILRHDVPVSVLFERMTIASIAEWLEAQPNSTMHTNDESLLCRVPRDGPLPVSLVQERMWLLHEGNRYNITMAYRLSGRLDLHAVKQSFAEIVRRHEALRTNIVSVGGQPMQIIRDTDFNLEIVDLRDQTKEERANRVEQLALVDASRTFDLATDALFGATLVRLEEDTDHALLLVMHHIIVDATSIEMILREFTILYDTYRLGLSSPLPDVPIQYADFAVWQRAWFSPARRAEQLAYWRNKLKDAPSSLGSLVPRPRPTNLSARAEWSSITLPKTLTSHVRALGKELDVTQFITLLAAFEVALSRLSGQPDIVASTSATHRKQIECEQICGCFLHVIPFRADVSKARTFVDFIHQLQRGMLEALPYLDVTSGRLDAALFPLRNMKQDPLIQISFSSAPTLGLAGKLSDIEVSDIDVPVQDFAKNDLAVFATETDDSITLRARYKADLLAPETMKRLLAEFEHVLEVVTADPHQQLHAHGANP